MVKFIVAGDLHYRGTTPRARLDDFQEALNRKLHEVYELAVKHEVAAIIIPGDVFDGPSPGWGTVTELGRVLQAAPCPVLAIPGNHDIWAGNPGSKHRTPFGMLSRLGMLYDVSEDVFEHSEAGAAPVFITGHGFTVETDTELGKEQYSPWWQQPERGEAFHVHVVHSMLMDQRPGFEMRHTLVSQVETTADVVISGHEHVGFGIHHRGDGVTFINPGALCRLSAHHAEIERQVQVALLTVENGSAKTELIPLKSAAPGHEVLSRAHLEAEAERGERLEKFLSLLASEGESKFMEVREIVEDIAARENLPGEVKREALERIGKAREKLGSGVGVG